MIKITNGLRTIEVSTGAYKDIYYKQGFRSVVEVATEKPVAAESAVIETEEVELPEGTELVDEDEIPEDQKYCIELEEKPIAQWNKDETKKYAEIRGIDLTGTKNANDAKDRIKEFLEL